MHVRAIDTLDYAVSPTIHNQPVRLEVDEARQRELRRWLVLGVILLLAALFDGWQRNGIVSQGFEMDRVQRELAAEEAKGRHLRLDVAALQSPARIEAEATRRLNLVQPGRDDAVVIERVIPAPQPPSSVVASR